jgi:hypothetical protein
MAFYDTEFAEWGRALIIYPDLDLFAAGPDLSEAGGGFAAAAVRG